MNRAVNRRHGSVKRSIRSLAECALILRRDGRRCQATARIPSEIPSLLARLGVSSVRAGIQPSMFAAMSRSVLPASTPPDAYASGRRATRQKLDYTGAPAGGGRPHRHGSRRARNGFVMPLRDRSVLGTCALVALIAMSGVGVVTSAAGAAAPSSLELVFEGRYDETLQPEGEFTASGPFCSSGRMTTPLQLAVVEGSPRLLTCEDGSGSIVALVRPRLEQPAGVGSWKITSGTGDYAKLRGRGTFASHQTDPGLLDHGWFTFRSTWTGMAYLDDLAPAIDISRATAASSGARRVCTRSGSRLRSATTSRTTQ
jgi:hypothetical protein